MTFEPFWGDHYQVPLIIAAGLFVVCFFSCFFFRGLWKNYLRKFMFLRKIFAANEVHCESGKDGEVKHSKTPHTHEHDHEHKKNEDAEKCEGQVAVLYSSEQDSLANDESMLKLREQIQTQVKNFKSMTRDEKIAAKLLLADDKFSVANM